MLTKNINNHGEIIDTSSSSPLPNEKTLLLQKSLNQEAVGTVVCGSGDSSQNDTRREKEDVAASDRRKERERFYTIAALATSMVVQSFLLIGVFSYSGFMAMHLVPGLNEESTGSYSGWIASSFMVGRTLSSFGWGKVSDRYGRVFVIQASLLSSAVFSIMFGLSSSFAMALMWRFVLGLCNGLMGPIKVLITEFNRGDKNKETQMTAMVLGMWGFGFLINPAITGYLSDPVQQYPHSKFVQYFEPSLSAFPFLLPNIVGCIFCMIAYLLVFHFVQETLPVERLQSFWLELRRICLCLDQSNISKNPIIRTVSSWGLFKHLQEDQAEEIISNDIFSQHIPNNDDKRKNHDEEKGPVTNKQKETPATISSLWKRKATREHLLLYWVYSYLIVSLDESFPLFCLSKDNGLAVREQKIGNIFSGTGFFYVTIQYFLLTGLVKRFGFYKTLRIGAFFSVPLCCLLPLSLITNRSALQEGSLTLSTLLFLSIIYATIRVFSLLVFSTLTMTTNRTVSAHQRGTMQGLSMLGGSVAKAVGPATAGIFFSSSVETFTPPRGSVVVFIFYSFVGLCVGICALLLQEPDPLDDKVAPSSSGAKLKNVNNSGNDDKPPSF
jgi:MFS family permease